LSSLGSDFNRLIAGSVASSGDRLGSDPTFAALLKRPVTAGDVAVMDRVGADVLGSAVGMGIQRTIPFAAVLRVGIKALPYVGTAATIYSAYAAYRTYKDPSGQVAALQDDGQLSTPISVYQISLQNQHTGATVVVQDASPGAVCSDAIASRQSTGTYADSNYQYTDLTSFVSVSPTLCNFNAQVQQHYLGNPAACNPNCTTTGAPVGGSYGISQTTAQGCPATTDALDPTNSRQAGSAPSADGLCPTGRYTARNVVDAAAKLATAAQLAALAAKILQDGIGAGHGISPDNFPSSSVDPDTGTQLGPHQAPGDLTGPSSVAGPSTTTTVTPPGGSPSTSTTTPNAAVTYTNNTWNISSTTTTTNNGGTTTTTNAPPAPDPKTDCDKHPTDVACTDLGSAPAQPTLYTKKTKTFSDVLTSFKTTVAASPFGTALGGFFTVTAAGGTCPTWTWVIPYFNTTFVFDLLCQAAVSTILGAMFVLTQIIAAYVGFKIAVG
jgi:hypothetical protein